MGGGGRLVFPNKSSNREEGLISPSTADAASNCPCDGLLMLGGSLSPSRHIKFGRMSSVMAMNSFTPFLNPCLDLMFTRLVNMYWLNTEVIQEDGLTMFKISTTSDYLPNSLLE